MPDPTPYTLFVDRLALLAEIGVLPEEQGRTQRLVVSIRAEAVRLAPGDDLDAVVSYANLAADVRRVVAAGPVGLLETLAARIAAACLVRPGLRRLWLRLEKPDAVAGAESVGIEVTAEPPSTPTV